MTDALSLILSSSEKWPARLLLEDLAKVRATSLDGTNVTTLNRVRTRLENIARHRPELFTVEVENKQEPTGEWWERERFDSRRHGPAAMSQEFPGFVRHRCTPLSGGSPPAGVKLIYEEKTVHHYYVSRAQARELYAIDPADWPQQLLDWAGTADDEENYLDDTDMLRVAEHEFPEKTAESPDFFRRIFKGSNSNNRYLKGCLRDSPGGARTWHKDKTLSAFRSKFEEDRLSAGRSQPKNGSPANLQQLVGKRAASSG